METAIIIADFTIMCNKSFIVTWGFLGFKLKTSPPFEKAGLVSSVCLCVAIKPRG